MEDKKRLLDLQTPFNWSVPSMEQPDDFFIKRLEDKIQNTEDESGFHYKRFILDLLLAYEIYDKKKDFKAAYKHINNCAEYLESLIEEKSQDKLFNSIRTALTHVTYLTKAYLLQADGQDEQVPPLLKKITPVSKMNKREKAGILGIQAGLYIRYGTNGHRMALEYAHKAREMDEKQALYHFLVGDATGKIRRVENIEIIHPEEIEAHEKACSLEENATYILHLGYLYSQLSTRLYFKQPFSHGNRQSSKIYAKKAVRLFRSAIKLRPNCSDLKARVAHGLIRIRFKDVMDITYLKELLDEVIKVNPEKARAYHDLGMYYEKFENNTAKAIANLKKSNELFNVKSLTYMVSLKWQHQGGVEREIMKDLESSLEIYTAVEPLAEILANMMQFSILVYDDWPSAVKYATRCLKVDQSAKYLLKCPALSWRKTNLLKMLTYRLQNTSLKKLPESQEYLELTKDINYDSCEEITFDEWKMTQIKAIIRRKAD